MYSAGRINSVSAVDNRIPPITTVARGLCTSAPVLVAKAIGRKLREATSAVISTALEPRPRSFVHGVLRRVTLLAQACDDNNEADRRQSQANGLHVEHRPLLWNSAGARRPCDEVIMN